jgi:hypothetical protein
LPFWVAILIEIQAFNDFLSSQGLQGTIAMLLVASNGNFKQNGRAASSSNDAVAGSSKTPPAGSGIRDIRFVIQSFADKQAVHEPELVENGFEEELTEGCMSPASAACK